MTVCPLSPPLQLSANESVLHGIKVGLGAIIWASTAFIPATRPIYKNWKGEWGLLSYMIVIATTVGASNTTSLGRFRGTVAGATCAIVGWLLSDGEVFLLAFFGWLMSLYNFYLTFEAKKAQLGRTTLLAWNMFVCPNPPTSTDTDLEPAQSSTHTALPATSTTATKTT